MSPSGSAANASMRFIMIFTEGLGVGLGVNWSESYKPVRTASWDDIADSIKQTITMDDVVGMYAPDPPPRSRRIPCPIHNGKDYNLAYNNHNFHCYVCNEGGDVISFVRGVCGLKDRKEAMTKINDDFHMNLPINQRISTEESIVLQERRRKVQEREAEAKRLLTTYHAALDHFTFLDILMKDFKPNTLQYKFACQRIDAAWYDVECAMNALYEFNNRQKVISN